MYDLKHYIYKLCPYKYIAIPLSHVQTPCESSVEAMHHDVASMIDTNLASMFVFHTSDKLPAVQQHLKLGLLHP
jgi:hypothetical protein